MRLLLHDLELGAGDQLRDGAAERRAAGRVESSGKHERRHTNLREAVRRVVVEECVEEALSIRRP